MKVLDKVTITAGEYRHRTGYIAWLHATTVLVQLDNTLVHIDYADVSTEGSSLLLCWFSRCRGYFKALRAVPF